MTVHLVGVGPGEAELMTIKATRLLCSADAVVYDRLIGADVLDYVPPSAELYPVGKTPGERSPSQHEINDLLIALGRRLKTVVRVKGGDPFVFGRGIEEARATTGAGIKTEVVPGITSALAGPLAAGVSVTARGVASGVCVVTAHQDDQSGAIDWSAVARSGLTIVVLMGARRATDVRDRLMTGGLPAATPVAIVTNATKPDQQTRFIVLDQLGETPVNPPSVLIIGQVSADQHRIDELLSATSDTPASLQP